MKGNQPFLPRTLHWPFLANTRSLSVHTTGKKRHPSNKTSNRHISTRELALPFPCPFCEGPCRTSMESLWIHCLRRHSEYDIEIVQTDGGKLHLLAEKNPSHRKRRRLFGPATTETRNIKDGTSELVFWKRNEHPERPPPRRIQLPSRQYYHAADFSEKSVAAWLLDLDSDDDIDDSTWANEMTDAEIDEYTDVFPAQKKFFKRWNHFMAATFAGVPVPCKRVPAICLQFVREQALDLKQEGLENELICHLCNLFDEGHLGRVHITEVMELYNSLVE